MTGVYGILEDIVMHPSRIALTTTDNVFDAGGVENSIMRIARGLVERGMQVDILMLRDEEATAFHPEGGNGIMPLPSSMKGLSLYRITPWMGSELHEQRWIEMHYALLELARERRYDAMQAFYATIAGFPTVYTARLLGIPSIVSIRGSDLVADVFAPRWFPYLTWALQHATELTAVSQEGLERARVLCNDPHKGRVILNSIRPEDFEEGVEMFESLNITGPVIGSLAVFRAKKGVEVLLAAFQLLLKHVPDAHLLLVGYVVSAEQERFKGLIENYGLQGKVALTGRIDRWKSLCYLRAMDVFAFSSLHDGCPNAVLEAMLAARPIVATRAGALPEMIDDGKEGLLVQPGSAVELSQALVRMLEMGEEGWRYGERARERALRQFTLEREIGEYLELYRGIVRL
jgi:glycosyltransferase involved in cell wall biosynthesis